ncbi:competence protein CoiA [Lentilactobacillus laojiaonis]|uniref:competence protein CoiA n=1 Tax=Lentilactobacillus laojiaonis TaxID=2883998 RepID=UPI001D0A7C22|nr:competence protein CoiA family protein [Lentilactobacillus laojiaonis]UDM32455.1 hypothetical protein LHL71_01715 [Lentilactobacillus laojiaonis]
MILIAKQVKDQCLVVANQASKHEKYICPNCQEIVTLRQGTIKISHFAHQKDSNCTKLSENESRAHLLGKLFIYQSYVKLDSHIALEVVFKDIEQRADVCLPQCNLIIEYQCSPIKFDKLLKRTKGYQKMGYTVLWLLGDPYVRQKINKHLLAKFAHFSEKLGIYLMYYETTSRKLYLRYNIIEKNSKLIYQEKRFLNINAFYQFKQSMHIHEYLNSPMEINQYLINLQRKIISGSATYLKIVELCYQHGYIVVGCPMVCHDNKGSFPLFKTTNLEWKIWLILKIFNGKQLIWSKEQLNALFRQLMVNFNCQFIQIDNYTRLTQLLVLDFWDDLIRNKYIIRINEGYKIINFPRWYADLNIKQKTLLSKNKII